MNTWDDRDLQRALDFVEIYQQLTDWQKLKINTRMFCMLVGHFVRDYQGRSLAATGAELARLGNFFTLTIWPFIRQPLLMLTLAAIVGLLWGFTMQRLGL
jgi:hypothetical protein